MAITVVAFCCLVSGSSAASMRLEVFVLAGQSNMAGRGQPLSLAAPTDPRLVIWRSSAWQTAATRSSSPPTQRVASQESGRG